MILTFAYLKGILTGFVIGLIVTTIIAVLYGFIQVNRATYVVKIAVDDLREQRSYVMLATVMKCKNEKDAISKLEMHLHALYRDELQNLQVLNIRKVRHVLAYSVDGGVEVCKVRK